MPTAVATALAGTPTQTTASTTITTSAVFTCTHAALTRILASPLTLITLNPLVLAEATPDAGHHYTIKDSLSFLCFHSSTTYTADFEYPAGRDQPVVTTKASLGVRTRSTWRVERVADKRGEEEKGAEDAAEKEAELESLGEVGHWKVTEFFELLSAPWALRWYVLKTAAPAHEDLLEAMGERLVQAGEKMVVDGPVEGE